MHDLAGDNMQQTSRIRALLDLIRFDKPIGTLLLLWPTLWALWIAAEGVPPVGLLLVFAAGTFLMRSAGCIVNDLADRNLDGGVTRTSSRPLVTGAVSVREATVFFLVLMVLAFGLVLMTNPLTVKLSFVAALLASVYPLMKRITHLPQLVLGLAFSWGIHGLCSSVGRAACGPVAAGGGELPVDRGLRHKVRHGGSRG